jgi:hypothetical protein
MRKTPRAPLRTTGIVQHKYGASDVLEVQERLARVTGLLYLVLAVFGMFSFVVLENLVVPGDAATTADNILGSRWLFGSSLVTWIVVVLADVAVAVTLYLLLEPVGRALSLVAAAVRLVYAAILGAVLLNLYDAFRLLTGAERGAGLDAQQRQTMALSALATFSAGFLLALVFFGVHLVALGVLLYRSRYVPRAFGVLLVAAGAGYIADSLAKFFVAGHGGLASAVLVAPAVAGELGLTAWLLVKGVDVRREAAPSASFTRLPEHSTPAFPLPVSGRGPGGEVRNSTGGTQ